MCSCVCSVEWLVLDEADKLFENSPNDSGFREQVCIYIHINCICMLMRAKCRRKEKMI